MIELFKWVTGLEGKYQASNMGYIISYVKSKPKRIGGTKLSTKGYPRVRINGQTRFLHRIVAETFLSNPDKLPQVNHIDGNKLNNKINNLEWITNQENRDHAVKNHLIAFGEVSYSKLKLLEVLEIQRLYKTGKYTQKELGKLFNTTQQAVHSIISG